MSFGTLTALFSKLSFMLSTTIEPHDTGTSFGLAWVWVWTKLGQAICKIIYGMIQWMLAFVDFLQYFVQKLIGLDYWLTKTKYTIEGAVESDIIFGFLYNDTVQKVFRAMVAIFFVLLIIFTIYAIIKSEWEHIAGKGGKFGDGVGNSKNKIFKSSIKAIVMVLIFPLVLMMGIMSSNAILASLIKALNIDTSSTLGGQIFQIASQTASKYNIYAQGGRKNGVADEVSFFITEDEKYLKLSNAEEDESLVHRVTSYEDYLAVAAKSTKYTVDSVFAKVEPSETISVSGTKNFYGYCVELYDGFYIMAACKKDSSDKTEKNSADAMYYYLNNVLQANIITRDNHSGFSEVDDIYSRSDGFNDRGFIKNLNVRKFYGSARDGDNVVSACNNTWNYASIYTNTYAFEDAESFVMVKQGTNVIVDDNTENSGNRVIGGTKETGDVPTSNSLLTELGLGAFTNAKLMYNSGVYGSYFDGGQLGIVQLQAEYLVMGEVVNFINQNNLKLNVLDITSDLIDWSGSGTYKVDSKWISLNSSKSDLKYSYLADGTKLNSDRTLVTTTQKTVPFVVSYSDLCNDTEMGNVLYFGDMTEGNNELKGSKYIMCIPVDGGKKFIPLVNNKTYTDSEGKMYNFKSDYYASNYHGVVLAKGVLETKSVSNPERGEPTYFVADTNAQDDNEPYYFDMEVTGNFNQYAAGLGYYIPKKIKTPSSLEDQAEAAGYRIADVYENKTIDVDGTSTEIKVAKEVGLSIATESSAKYTYTVKTKEQVAKNENYVGAEYYIYKVEDGEETLVTPTSEIISNLTIKLKKGLLFNDVDFVDDPDFGNYTSLNETDKDDFISLNETDKGDFFATYTGISKAADVAHDPNNPTHKEMYLFELEDNYEKFYFLVYLDADDKCIRIVDNSYMSQGNSGSNIDYLDNTNIALDGKILKGSLSTSTTINYNQRILPYTYKYSIMYDYQDESSTLIQEQIMVAGPEDFVYSSTDSEGRYVYKIDESLAVKELDYKMCNFFITFPEKTSNLLSLDVHLYGNDIKFYEPIDSLYVDGDLYDTNKNGVLDGDAETPGTESNLYNEALYSGFYTRNNDTSIQRTQSVRIYLYGYYTAFVDTDGEGATPGKLYEYKPKTQTSDELIERPDNEDYCFDYMLSVGEFITKQNESGKESFVVSEANSFVTINKLKTETFSDLKDIPVKCSSIKIDGKTYYSLKTQNSYTTTGDMEKHYEDAKSSMNIKCIRTAIGYCWLETDIAMGNILKWEWRFIWNFFTNTIYSRSWEGYTFKLTDGIQFDYFFENDAKIQLDTFYVPSEISYWIIVIASMLMIKTLGSAIWGVIKRIYEITLYFLAAPAVASTMPLDDGSRFTTYIVKPLTQKVLGTYGTMLGINVFFILLYPVKSLSQIFTAEDIATSNSYFLQHFMGGLFDEQTRANMLNLYVYILFVLVAFTMISSLPTIIQNLAGGGEDLSKSGETTKKSAMKNLKDTADFIGGNKLAEGVTKTWDWAKGTAVGKTITAFRGAGQKAKNSVSDDVEGESYEDSTEKKSSREDSEEESLEAEIQNKAKEKLEGSDAFKGKFGGRSYDTVMASGSKEEKEEAQKMMEGAVSEVENEIANGDDEDKKKILNRIHGKHGEAGETSGEPEEAPKDAAENAAQTTFSSSMQNVAGELGGDAKKMRRNTIRNLAGSNNKDVTAAVSKFLTKDGKDVNTAAKQLFSTRDGLDIKKQELLEATLGEEWKEKYSEAQKQNKGQKFLDSFNIVTEMGDDGKLKMKVTSSSSESGFMMGEEHQVDDALAESTVVSLLNDDEIDKLAEDGSLDSLLTQTATENIAAAIDFNDVANDPLAEQVTNDILGNSKDEKNGKVIDQAMYDYITNSPVLSEAFRRITQITPQQMKDDPKLVMDKISQLRAGGTGLKALNIKSADYKLFMAGAIQKGVRNGTYQLSAWDMFKKNSGKAQAYIEAESRKTLTRSTAEAAYEAAESRKAAESADAQTLLRVMANTGNLDPEKINQLFAAFNQGNVEQGKKDLEALKGMSGFANIARDLVGPIDNDMYIKAIQLAQLNGEEVNVENIKSILGQMQNKPEEAAAAMVNAMLSNQGKGDISTVANMVNGDKAIFDSDELGRIKDLYAQNGFLGLDEYEQRAILSSEDGITEEIAKNMSLTEVKAILEGQTREQVFDRIRETNKHKAVIDDAMNSEDVTTEELIAEFGAEGNEQARDVFIAKVSQKVRVTSNQDAADAEAAADDNALTDMLLAKRRSELETEKLFDKNGKALEGDAREEALADIDKELKNYETGLNGKNLSQKYAELQGLGEKEVEDEVETEVIAQTAAFLKDQFGNGKNADFNEMKQNWFKNPNNVGKSETEFYKALAQNEGGMLDKLSEDANLDIKAKQETFRKDKIVSLAVENIAGYEEKVDAAKESMLEDKNREKLAQGYAGYALAVSSKLSEDPKVMKDAMALYNQMHLSDEAGHVEFEDLDEYSKAAFILANFEGKLDENERNTLRRQHIDKDGKDVFAKFAEDPKMFREMYDSMASFEGDEDGNEVAARMKSNILKAKYEKYGGNIALVVDPDTMDADTRKHYDNNHNIIQGELRDNPEIIANIFKNNTTLGQDKIIADIAAAQGIDITTEDGKNALLRQNKEFMAQVEAEAQKTGKNKYEVFKDMAKNANMNDLKGGLDNKAIVEYMNSNEKTKDKYVALGAQNIMTALDKDTQDMKKVEAVINSPYLRTQVANEVLKTNEVTKDLDEDKIKYLIEQMLEDTGRGNKLGKSPQEANAYITAHLSELKTELAMQKITQDSKGGYHFKKDTSAFIDATMKLDADKDSLFHKNLDRDVTNMIDPANFDPETSSQNFFAQRSIEEFRTHDDIDVHNMAEAINKFNGKSFKGFTENGEVIVTGKRAKKAIENASATTSTEETSEAVPESYVKRESKKTAKVNAENEAIYQLAKQDEKFLKENGLNENATFEQVHAALNQDLDKKDAFKNKARAQALLKEAQEKGMSAEDFKAKFGIDFNRNEDMLAESIAAGGLKAKTAADKLIGKRDSEIEKFKANGENYAMYQAVINDKEKLAKLGLDENATFEQVHHALNTNLDFKKELKEKVEFDAFKEELKTHTEGFNISKYGESVVNANDQQLLELLKNNDNAKNAVEKYFSSGAGSMSNKIADETKNEMKKNLLTDQDYLDYAAESNVKIDVSENEMIDAAKNNAYIKARLGDKINDYDAVKAFLNDDKNKKYVQQVENSVKVDKLKNGTTGKDYFNNATEVILRRKGYGNVDGISIDDKQRIAAARRTNIVRDRINELDEDNPRNIEDISDEEILKLLEVDKKTREQLDNNIIETSLKTGEAKIQLGESDIAGFYENQHKKANQEEKRYKKLETKGAKGLEQEKDAEKRAQDKEEKKQAKIEEANKKKAEKQFAKDVKSVRSSKDKEKVKMYQAVMNNEEMRTKLGLGEDATFEQVHEAIDGLENNKENVQFKKEIKAAASKIQDSDLYSGLNEAQQKQLKESLVTDQDYVNLAAAEGVEVSVDNDDELFKAAKKDAYLVGRFGKDGKIDESNKAAVLEFLNNKDNAKHKARVEISAKAAKIRSGEVKGLEHATDLILHKKGFDAETVDVSTGELAKTIFNNPELMAEFNNNVAPGEHIEEFLKHGEHGGDVQYDENGNPLFWGDEEKKAFEKIMKKNSSFRNKVESSAVGEKIKNGQHEVKLSDKTVVKTYNNRSDEEEKQNARFKKVENKGLKAAAKEKRAEDKKQEKAEKLAKREVHANARFNGYSDKNLENIEMFKALDADETMKADVKKKLEDNGKEYNYQNVMKYLSNTKDENAWALRKNLSAKAKDAATDTLFKGKKYDELSVDQKKLIDNQLKSKDKDVVGDAIKGTSLETEALNGSVNDDDVYEYVESLANTEDAVMVTEADRIAAAKNDAKIKARLSGQYAEVDKKYEDSIRKTKSYQEAINSGKSESEAMDTAKKSAEGLQLEQERESSKEKVLRDYLIINSDESERMEKQAKIDKVRKNSDDMKKVADRKFGTDKITQDEVTKYAKKNGIEADFNAIYKKASEISGLAEGSKELDAWVKDKKNYEKAKEQATYDIVKSDAKAMTEISEQKRNNAVNKYYDKKQYNIPKRASDEASARFQGKILRFKDNIGRSAMAKLQAKETHVNTRTGKHAEGNVGNIMLFNELDNDDNLREEIKLQLENSGKTYNYDNVMQYLSMKGNAELRGDLANRVRLKKAKDVLLDGDDEYKNMLEKAKNEASLNGREFTDADADALTLKYMANNAKARKSVSAALNSTKKEDVIKAVGENKNKTLVAEAKNASVSDEAVLKYIEDNKYDIKVNKSEVAQAARKDVDVMLSLRKSKKITEDAVVNEVRQDSFEMDRIIKNKTISKTELKNTVLENEEYLKKLGLSKDSTGLEVEAALSDSKNASVRAEIEHDIKIKSVTDKEITEHLNANANERKVFEDRAREKTKISDEEINQYLELATNKDKKEALENKVKVERFRNTHSDEISEIYKSDRNGKLNTENEKLKNELDVKSDKLKKELDEETKELEYELAAKKEQLNNELKAKTDSLLANANNITEKDISDDEILEERLKDTGKLPARISMDEINKNAGQVAGLSKLSEFMKENATDKDIAKVVENIRKFHAKSDKDYKGNEALLLKDYFKQAGEGELRMVENKRIVLDAKKDKKFIGGMVEAKKAEAVKSAKDEIKKLEDNYGNQKAQLESKTTEKKELLQMSTDRAIGLEEESVRAKIAKNEAAMEEDVGVDDVAAFLGKKKSAHTTKRYKKNAKSVEESFLYKLGVAKQNAGIAANATVKGLGAFVGVRKKDGKTEFNPLQGLAAKGTLIGIKGAGKGIWAGMKGVGVAGAATGKGIAKGFIAGTNAIIFKTSGKLPDQHAKYDRWNKVINHKINAIKNDTSLSVTEKKKQIEIFEKQKIYLQKPAFYNKMSSQDQIDFDENQNKLKRSAYTDKNLNKYVRTLKKVKRTGNQSQIGINGELIYETKVTKSRKEKHLDELNQVTDMAHRLKATAAMRNYMNDYGKDFEQFATKFLDKHRYHEMMKRYKLVSWEKYRFMNTQQQEKERKKREQALAAQIMSVQRTLAKKVAKDNKVNKESFLAARGLIEEIPRYKNAKPKFDDRQDYIPKLNKKYAKEIRDNTESISQQARAAMIDKTMQELIKFSGAYRGNSAEFAEKFKAEVAKLGATNKEMIDKIYKKYANLFKGQFGRLENKAIAIQQRAMMEQMAQELKKCQQRITSKGKIPSTAEMNNLFAGKTFTGATTKAEIALHRERAEELTRLVKLISEQKNLVSYDSLSKRIMSTHMADFNKHQGPKFNAKSEIEKKNILEGYFRDQLKQALDKMNNDKYQQSNKDQLTKLNGRRLNKSEVDYSKRSSTLTAAMKTADNPIYQKIVREYNSASEKVKTEQFNYDQLYSTLMKLKAAPRTANNIAQTIELQKAVEKSKVKLRTLNNMLNNAKSKKSEYEHSFAQTEIMKAKSVSNRAYNISNVHVLDRYSFPKADGTQIVKGTQDGKQVEMLVSNYIQGYRSTIESMLKTEIIKNNNELRNYVDSMKAKFTNDFGKNMRYTREVKQHLEKYIKEMEKQGKLGDTRLKDEITRRITELDRTEKILEDRMRGMNIKLSDVKLKK